MSGSGSKRPGRVPVARDGTTLGEFAALQIPSLLETGYLRSSDVAFDFDEKKWVPVGEFVRSRPGFARKARSGEGGGTASAGRRGSRTNGFIWGWVFASVFLVVAVVAGVLFLTREGELESARKSLATAEEEVAELRAENNRLQVRSSLDAPEGMIQGRMVIRDANNRRIAPPNVKVRLFRRETIEEFANERHATLPEDGATDANRLAVHFGSNLPSPVLSTATDSQGHFELAVPEPGEYVLQSSVRSAKTGESYTWFLSFDSRDALNTPINLNEANRARQFHPLFLISEGR